MVKWKIEKPSCEVHKQYYILNGHKYSRVTSVLGVIAKHGLAIWYSKVGERKAKEILETRQIIGTKTHHIFEMNLLGKDFDINEYEQEIKDSFILFKDFKINTKLEVHSAEQRLWSETYGFAGTADYLGMYTTYDDYLVRGHKAKFTDGGLVIIDWKTSRSIYKEAFLQLSAYTHAFYELTGIKIDGAAIAHFRDGKLKVREKTFDELMELFEVYKCALKLYKWTHNIEDKNEINGEK